MSKQEREVGHLLAPLTLHNGTASASLYNHALKNVQSIVSPKPIIPSM